jgi:hypothetical protein
LKSEEGFQLKKGTAKKMFQRKSNTSAFKENSKNNDKKKKN